MKPSTRPLHRSTIWLCLVLPCTWLDCSSTALDDAKYGIGGSGSQGYGGTAGATNATQHGGGTAGSCYWGPGTADPYDVPMNCDTAGEYVNVYGEVQGSSIVVRPRWCQVYCGAYTCARIGAVINPTITVDSAWATVTTDSTASCTVAILEPASGVTEGDISFVATVNGSDQCHGDLTCSIANRYHVSIGSDGTVTFQKN